MYNFVEHHDNLCKEATHYYKNNEAQAKFAYELLEEKLFNIIRNYRNLAEEELIIQQMTILGQQILRDKFIISLVHHLKNKEQTIQQSCGIINNLSYSLQSHIKSLCYLAFQNQEIHLLGLKHFYNKYFNCDLLQLSMVLDTRITYLVQDPTYIREHLLIKFCHRYNWNWSIFNIQYVNQYTTYYQAFNMEFIQEDNDFVGPPPSNPYNYQQNPSAYQQPYGYQNSSLLITNKPLLIKLIGEPTIPIQQLVLSSQLIPKQSNQLPIKQQLYTLIKYLHLTIEYLSLAIQYLQQSSIKYIWCNALLPAQVPNQFSNAVSQYSNNQMVQPQGYQQNSPAFQPVLQSFSQPQINAQEQQIANTYAQPQPSQVPYPVQQPIPQQIQQTAPINNQNTYNPQQIQPQINSPQLAQNQIIDQQQNINQIQDQQQQQNNINISNNQQNQQVQNNQYQNQQPNNPQLQDQQQQQAKGDQDNSQTTSSMTQTIILSPEPTMQESTIIKRSPGSQEYQIQETQQQPQQTYECVKSDGPIQDQQAQEVQAVAPQQNSDYPQTTLPQQDQPQQDIDLKKQLLDESVEFISTIKGKQENDFNQSDSIFIVPKPQPQIQIVDFGSVCEQLFLIRKPYINQINFKEDGLIPQIKLVQSNNIQNRKVDTPFDLDESALSRMERRIQSQKYQKVDLDQFIKQVLIDW
ncbi:hypothetical protein pb186bvf_002811 [Paramecium bursaria]